MQSLLLILRLNSYNNTKEIKKRRITFVYHCDLILFNNLQKHREVINER